LLVIGLILVVIASINIGPALSAFQGHGTRGYFVAESHDCSSHGCTWDGRFQLPDGRVTRSSVSFVGSYLGMHVGSVCSMRQPSRARSSGLKASSSRKPAAYCSATAS
jgi:hypothetical protein